MSLLKALDLPALPGGGAASPAGGADAKSAALDAAAAAWRQVVGEAGHRVAALQKAVRAACAGEPPSFVEAAEKGLATLDGALGPVDGRLADELERAADPALRDAALAEARRLFEVCTSHLKSATLIAHIDRQPFGVKTDLKAAIVEGLGRVAKALK